jgi:hypothetical protein
MDGFYEGGRERMTNQKIRSDQIIHQLQLKHREDCFFTEVKNGPSWTSNGLLILDAIAVKKSWSKPLITGYEIKVDRGDFVRDNKWVHYLQYCHKFYFVCPKDLIKPEELPAEVGLMYCNPETLALSTKHVAPMRTIEFPGEMFNYIVMSKLESDRHPFFSNHREQLEALVKDKGDRRYLSHEVNQVIGKKIKELEKRAEDAEFKAGRFERKADEAKYLEETIRKAGINTQRWNWKGDLERALKTGMPLGTEQKIENAIQTLQGVLESVKECKEVQAVEQT